MSSSALDAEMAQRIQMACNCMENAPDAATRTEADQFLQSFRSSVRPYALCTLLLQSEGASPAVQFVALATMKEALRREGRLLGAAQLQQLKEQLLQLVVARVHQWSRYVLKQCLHVIAILFKWICLDADEVELRSRARASPSGRPGASPPPESPSADPLTYINMANTVGAWLQRGMEALESESNGGAQLSSNGAASSLFSLSLELSQALISEFSPGGQAANAGVSVSMHVRCHARFEEHVLANLTSAVVGNCLPALLQRSMTLAQQPAAAAAASAPPALLMQLQVLHSLLSFLDATLHYDFRDPKRPDALAMKWALASASSAASAAAEDAPQPATVILRPAPRWGAMLVRAPLIEMLATAHTLLQGLGQRWGEAALEARWPAVGDASHLLRNCLLQLASLRGEVLNTPKDASSAAGDAAAAGGALGSPAAVRGATAFFERLLGALNSMMQGSLSTASAQLAAQGAISELAGAQLLGGAAIFNRLLCNVNVEELLRLSNASLLPQLVQLQTQLALLLLPLSNGGGPRAVHGVQGARRPRVQTSTFVAEALDACLDVWYTVITQLDELGQDQLAALHCAAMGAGGGALALRRDAPPPESLRQLQQLVHQGSGAVFEAYVVARVQALESLPNSASNNQDEDEDEDDEEEEEEGQFAEEGYIDEHMGKVACLGKVHLPAALGLLTQHVLRATQAWQGQLRVAQGLAPASAAGTVSPFAVYELLYFALRLLGHLCSPCASWKEVESDAMFACIPPQVLDAAATEAGAQAVHAALEAVVGLAYFVSQLLEYAPPAPPGSMVLPPSSSTSSSALKECCSPLVLECLVWLLQQLLSAGYFLIDERGAVDRRNLCGGGGDAPTRPFPPALLHLYGAGGGVHTDRIVEALFRLSGALLVHYNEEPALMDLVADFLSLCVRHAPLRARMVGQLTAPPGAAPPGQFKTLFHDALLSLLTADPFAVMGAATAASSDSTGSDGVSGGQLVMLRYQASQPLYNLSPAMVQRLSHVLVQSAVIRPEDDMAAAAAASSGPGLGLGSGSGSPTGDLRAHRRAQSLSLLHSTLSRATQSFYSCTLHPRFPCCTHRGPVLKSLANLVSFWAGAVAEVNPEYFEFMWHWLTCTEAAAGIPAGAHDLEARVRESQNQSQARLRQSKITAAQRCAAAGGAGRGHGNGGASGDAGGGRNILQSMVDLVATYGAEPSPGGAASSPSDAGSSLELLQCVLTFFTSLCGTYLSYLDVSQSYMLMASTLQLVTGFTRLMERRTSASAMALRAAEQNQLRQQHATMAAAAHPAMQHLLAKQQLKTAALASDLSLLEESEWSSLRALLQLLEGLSSKDLVDLSAESVEFASDAVMQGLVLLVPRLSAGSTLLAQPEVALLFFGLLSNLVASNPDKLASALDEKQREQMMRMIQMVLQPPTTMTTATTGSGAGSGAGAAASPSPSAAAASSSLFGRTTAQLHSALLKEACLAVQALAQYHLYFVSGRADADRAAHAKEEAAAAAGGEAGKRAQLNLQSRPALPPPSPYGPACTAFLESLLQLLLFSHVSSELLEAVSDALLPTILCQQGAFVQLVQGALAQWKGAQMAKLQSQAAGFDPAAQQAQAAQMEAMGAELEAAFRALVPTGAAGGKSGSHGGGVMMSAVGGRFSSLSTRTMQVERSQRMLFRQQVRTFVLTARPLLQMR